MTHFKILIRSIFKDSWTFLINVCYLTIGLSVTLVTFGYLYYEFSYDRFHNNAENMYRVVLDANLSGQEIYAPVSNWSMGQKLSEELPEVIETTRFRYDVYEYEIEVEDQIFSQDQVIHADSNFFQFFNFDVLVGNPKTFLNDPSSIVLTEQIALKLFNSTDVLNETVTMGRKPLKVTGVVKAPPTNSHIQFSVIASIYSHRLANIDGWFASNFFTYFRVIDGTNIEELERKFQNSIESSIALEIQKQLGVSYERYKESGGDVQFIFIPMLDSHLFANFSADISPPTDFNEVLVFSLTAILIVVLIFINIINLNSARYYERTKSIGVRLIFGANKADIYKFFMFEALFICTVATVLSCLLLYTLSQGLSSGLDIVFLSFRESMVEYLVVAIGLIVLASLVFGFYPSWYFSRVKQPRKLMYNQTVKIGKKWARYILVLFQYVSSITLVIFVVVIFNQYSFLRDKDVGFKDKEVLVITNASRLGASFWTFREELKSKPEVLNTTYTSSLFFNDARIGLFKEPKNQNDISMKYYHTDSKHIESMQLEIIKGRNFDENFNESENIIINEKALKVLGIQSIEGQKIWSRIGFKEFNIIGVIKDFYFEPFTQDIQPLVLFNTPKFGYSNLYISFSQGKSAETIELVENLWDDFGPKTAVKYQLLDEHVDSKLSGIKDFRRLLLILTAIAIVTSSLGLIGLSKFYLERKRKEISVRKVLGASSSSIFLRFTSYFLILFGLSFFVAGICSYFISNRWLQNYQERISMDWTLYTNVGVSGILLIIFITAFYSIQASIINPSLTLKTE